MKREYGPEGQIIIRGFPKSTPGRYEVPRGPGILERIRNFLQFYWPAIFILLVLLAASAGTIAAWTSSDDGSAALTEQELAALVAGSESGGAYTPGMDVPSVSAPAGSSVERLPIHILSEPEGATVQIDFQPVGTTPLRDYRLPRGVYVLSVGMAGGARIDSVVILDETSERTFFFSPETRREAITSRAEGGRDDASPNAASVADARRDDSSTQRSGVAAGLDAPERSGPVSQPSTRTTSSPPAPEPVAPGELVVTSSPAGAAVWIDGERRGTTPLQARGITPGRRELRITMDGYTEVQDVLAVESARTVMRTYELSALQGTVVVQVRPWGSIYVDGELRARDLDVRHAMRLPVGSYRIAAVHPVLGRREMDVRVQAGQTQDVTIDLTTAPPADR